MAANQAPSKVEAWEAFLRDEWKAISEAPFFFLTALGILVGIGWVALSRAYKWHNAKIIGEKDATIRAQQEALTGLETQKKLPLKPRMLP